MRNVRTIYILAALTLIALTTVVSADSLTPIFDPAPPNSASLLYDPSTGNLSYSGNGTLITTMELRSASSLFIPENVSSEIVWGPFDVNTKSKLFRLITAGIEGEDFGPVLPAGLSFEAVLNDIAIDGSIKPAGKLRDAPGGGPYLQGIPEPSSVVLAGFGLLSLLGMRRRS